MAIPQLCVYHYDDKAHVTGWGHSAVTYNPDTCVAEWHMGRYVSFNHRAVWALRLMRCFVYTGWRRACGELSRSPVWLFNRRGAWVSVYFYFHTGNLCDDGVFLY